MSAVIKSVADGGRRAAGEVALALTALEVATVQLERELEEARQELGRLRATSAAVATGPSAIPEPFLLALLKHANDSDCLDVAEDELLDHHRTRAWREILPACWIAAQAEALGWQVEVNDLGDRLLVLDRKETAR